MTSYDNALCFLTYLDGNWMFTLPNQCEGQICTWNVYGAPYVTDVMPPSFNEPKNYTCDNNAQELPWLNAEDEQTLLNRYYCTCGGPISVPRLAVNISNGCEDRCTRPWTPAFGKRCNIVTKSFRGKGNFTTSGADPSQGACISIAGEGPASPTFGSPINPTAYTVIDGIGIANVCDGNEYSTGSGLSICTCDGQLPATAFGKRVENRNPCYLKLDADATAVPSRAWIAGPVVGGVALLALVGVLGLFAGRRTRRRKAVMLEDHGPGVNDIPLHDVGTAPTNASSAPRSPSLNSQATSADSGVGLLTVAPAEEPRKE